MATSEQSQTPGEIESLISDVLHAQFGRKVLDISLDHRSNNSRVYILTLDPTDNSQKSQSKPISQSGVVQLPEASTKAVIRFINPEANLNEAVRVTSDVASMAISRQALASFDIPLVPQVYGWSDQKPGWVLMEFMEGVPLGREAFAKLDHDAKREILKQMAQIAFLIQKYELPASVKGYGGLGLSAQGDVVVGPTPFYGASDSCRTYHELYGQYLQTQIAAMDRCDVVRGWRDTDLRARIDNFATNGFKPLLQRASDDNPRPTLVHGDFDIHNLLFDASTNRITALLDYDFCHIASAADEYFYSFDSVHGLVPPPEADDIEDLQLLRQCLLQGFHTDATASKPPSTGLVNWEVATMRDEEFFIANVQRPVDLMPGIELLSELYWFIQNISPGAFFLPKFRAKRTPKQMEMMRLHYQEQLRQTLSGWGF